MKNPIYFFLVLLLMYQSLSAQKRYTMPEKPIAYKLINKQVLYDEVLNDMRYDFHVVTIYTNFCAGTPYYFQRLKRFDSIGYKNIHWVPCSSADLRDSLETVQVLKKYGVYPDTVYLINSAMYKEKRSDDRYKGFVFRKDICEPCVKDIIGVPYTIIYNNRKEIVAKGYIHSNEEYVRIFTQKKEDK